MLVEIPACRVMQSLGPIFNLHCQQHKEPRNNNTECNPKRRRIESDEAGEDDGWEFHILFSMIFLVAWSDEF